VHNSTLKESRDRTTRAKFLEQLQSGPSRTAADMSHPHDSPGRQRLFEEREQHDEADKNSEKNRLDRDIAEHGHNRDNFQVRGGSASSRVARRDHINPTEPDGRMSYSRQPSMVAVRSRRVNGIADSHVAIRDR
jgi:hypothetical protein